MQISAESSSLIPNIPSNSLEQIKLLFGNLVDKAK